MRVSQLLKTMRRASGKAREEEDEVEPWKVVLDAKPMSHVASEIAECLH